jgi:hypothetical protein
MKPGWTVALCLLAGLQGCADSESAPAPTPAPAPSAADWIKASDGSYTHKPSGATCPTSVQGFSLKGLDLSATEGSLGICDYADSAGRIAEIRVRQYLPGVGETALATENDRKLMESSGGQRLDSTIRVGPGPAIDGQTSQRDVITIRRNDLLIDCAAWEKLAPSTDNSAIMDFAINCLHMPGE